MKTCQKRKRQRMGHRGRRMRRGERPGGPETFRLGRALSFFEQLETKRQTIVDQLDRPEFETIRPTLVGELKALDEMIAAYVQHFELSSIVSEVPHDEGNE